MQPPEARVTDYRTAPLGSKVAIVWLEDADQPGSPAATVNLAVIAP